MPATTFPMGQINDGGPPLWFIILYVVYSRMNHIFFSSAPLLIFYSTIKCNVHARLSQNIKAVRVSPICAFLTAFEAKCLSWNLGIFSCTCQKKPWSVLQAWWCTEVDYNKAIMGFLHVYGSLEASFGDGSSSTMLESSTFTLLQEYLFWMCV